MEEREWQDHRLDWSRLPVKPMELFTQWHALASATEPWHGGAMLLSTCSGDGQLSARIVLMRGFDERGVRFFTNYESRKGRALLENPRFAVVFWWPSQVRQVRMEGMAERLPRSASEAYFAERPRGSQLGAWSSPQSEVIPDLDALSERYGEIETRFAGKAVTCPPHWGGYQLLADRVEFWQGGKDRLHDRALYELDAGEDWILSRLAP